MSRLRGAILLALACLFVTAFAGSGVPTGDPYYRYIKTKNPKLRPHDIAVIINANRKYSTLYHYDMFWHMSKSGHESGYKTTVGKTFIVGGHKYNNEPCYGIECLEVSTVKGMYPKFSDQKIQNLLLHDYNFAISCAYRLDSANSKSATRMGYKSKYANRVVTIIIYNSGLGNWKKYHYNLARYIKQGGKLEDLTVRDWKRLHLSFREIYSLNYYVNVTEEADLLEKLSKDSELPTPVSVTPTVEATTPKV